jgi:D-alanyl-D-alanine carboxypeptidase
MSEFEDIALAESPFATGAPEAGFPALPASWPELEEQAGGTSAGRLALADALVLWNAMSAPVRVDVVVHLHGDNTQQDQVRLVEDLLPISGLDLTDPADPTALGRTRPTVAVLPRGEHVGSGKFRYPALDGPGALDAFLARCLDGFTGRTGVRAPRGRLVLTAHSGGGYAVERLLADNDPDELHLFDAFYPAPTQLVRWLRRHVEQDRSTGEAFRKSGALRALYHDPGTRPNMEAAQVALCRALSGSSGLADRYRIEQTSTRHCDIPRLYGWRLLADAAADLPATTPIPCPRRRAATENGELEALHAEGERQAGADPELEDLDLEDLEWEDPEREDLEWEDLEWEDPEREDPEREDLDLDAGEDAAAEELFEAEESARHAVFAADAGEAEDGEAPRPAVRTTAFLRRAWHADACAESRMVPLRLFGRWTTPVNPATVDAWRALERALVEAGYEVHRAWVFNCRTIRGQRTRSLHAYGLAIDIDHARPSCNVNRPTPDGRAVRFSTAATKQERCHDVQRGVADTSFTAAQVAAVEAIRTVDGHQVFAWGGRWRTTKDTMHFQINVTPDELARGLAPGPGGLEAELEDQAAGADRYGGIAVTPGAFGRTLRRFAAEWTVPDSVLWLLQRSPTYVAIAKDLDDHYVEGNLQKPSDAGPQSADGVFTAGSNRGRRRIYFHPSSHGSFFSPYGDPDNSLAGDVIWLQRPAGTGDPTAPTTLQQRGQWLEMIAHESAHAARLVRGQRRSGGTPAERVRSAIDDEIATRGVERRIVDELRAKFPRFAAYRPTTGSRDRAQVERDTFPGEQRRTYLEHFVLGELLAAARREVTDEQAKQYANIVGRISLGSPPFTPLLSLQPTFVHRTRGRIPLFRLRYPNVLLALRVIAARWQAAAGADETVLERMRQEHAAAFFDGLVRYTVP